MKEEQDNDSPAQGEPAAFDGRDPKNFINRDLSLLQFNRRVLQQALDPHVPLLERLRFLTITSTNLDEFFEVRAASHREQALHGSATRTLDGLTSREILEVIAREARDLVREQYRTLNSVLLPALAAEGLRLRRRTDWTTEETAWVRDHFQTQVLPVLTPVGLDPAHPFPRILNKSLNFIVVVEGHDAYERDADIAVVQVPRALPRVIAMPHTLGPACFDMVLLSSVIHAHIGELFPGMTVKECHQFRVTRNGDLWVDEEEVDNLLQALRGELPERQFAEAVRLEVTEDCPDFLARFLLDRFSLGENDLYRVDGPVNLHRLSSILQLVDRPDLRDKPFTPSIPRALAPLNCPFAALRASDIVLHHPYESFQPVLDLLRRAAEDPDVLAIKQTIYRVGPDAPVAQSLMRAARAGKQVTVVIELRARFEEAHNIDLATQLQEVGASVVYGIVGSKIHAKMLMIVRREQGALRRYCHLGTGNYHAGTTKSYTDLALLTAKPDIGDDVHQMFLHLSGLGEAPRLTRLLQSPFAMHKALLAAIDAEAARAARGEPARIVAKLNALTEAQIIERLYNASKSGVQIDLIVRGACCLRPGVPGLSEHITVRSIIGRFLEHSRLYWFHEGGNGRLYASSADWMSRNLIRRVETCFPIDDALLRDRLLSEDLFNYLESDVRAWILQSDGVWSHTDLDGTKGFVDPQRQLLKSIAGNEGI